MKIKRVIEIDKEVYERITNRIKTMREEMRISEQYNEDVLPFDWVAIADSKPYEDRPQGEWKSRIGIFYCSNCGFELDEHLIRQNLPNFCEDCGADMRGAKE